jgi:ketosteroid isomerase-like protein
MGTSALTSLDQIKLAMASTNNLFNTEVFAKRNFDALDNVYTADARILPPGAPMISGRQAIKEFWFNLIISREKSRMSFSGEPGVADHNRQTRNLRCLNPWK